MERHTDPDNNIEENEIVGSSQIKVKEKEREVESEDDSESYGSEEGDVFVDDIKKIDVDKER